jgi:ornithine cyclodeaminase/alanine dehydrogenase-like protein (mu-crystallin family)
MHAMLPFLTDDDVTRLVSMRDAIDAIEQALLRKAGGTFLTPPRHYFGTPKGTLAFTIGGDAERGAVGFRVYSMYAASREDDQLVVVYDATTGELRGIIQGERVGAMRTGALGGIAVKYAAREDAKVLAIIGSGRQASTQLEAASVVRKLTTVRVFSRSAENRQAFASGMSAQLDLPVRAVASPAEAIAGADIVIVATSSRMPVFNASLIEPGQHVTTIRLGRGQHELDGAVADRTGAIITDSLEQLKAYPGGFFLPDRLASITELSQHVAGDRQARATADDITLYLSAGLSGTEVVLGDLALRKAHAAS